MTSNVIINIWPVLSINGGRERQAETHPNIRIDGERMQRDFVGH